MMSDRQFFDAWFQMLAIPGQVYLYWVREIHQHARPASVYRFRSIQ